VASDTLSILLLSGSHDRAHTAFSLASAAAALGRATTLFASNAGCRALLADWSGLDEVGRDAVMRRRGVAGLGEVRDAAREVGVRLMACDASIKAEGLSPHDLLDGVQIAGLATFLEAARGGQIITV
jgi:peroxiredoxin family protein